MIGISILLWHSLPSTTRIRSQSRLLLFRLNTGRDPPLPTTIGTGSRVPSAQAFADNLQESLKEASAALELARNRQKQYADTKRRHITYQVGDRVLLSTKNIKLRTGCSKFLPRWLGPFTIIDHCAHHRSGKAGIAQAVAYKLDLPDSMHILPVFHVSLLQPYHDSGKGQPPPIPAVLDGEAWYQLEKILQHRDTKVCIRAQTKHRPAKYAYKREYFVKYCGFSDEHNSWEPLENVTEAAIAD